MVLHQTCLTLGYGIDQNKHWDIKSKVNWKAAECV